MAMQQELGEGQKLAVGSPCEVTCQAASKWSMNEPEPLKAAMRTKQRGAGKSCQ